MAGIYIHIPFCKQACHYCDFHFSTSSNNKAAIINAMAIEIGLQKSYLADEQIKSVYIGGGTPSLLSADELDIILQAIHKTFPVSSEAEITLEANPDDLFIEKLLDFKNVGINRLSLGIQSFDDDVLKFLNRAHNSRAAINSFTQARKAGFENISIDLIYAIPGQDLNAWKRNIEQAIVLDPEHISSYSLTIEEKTVFGKWAIAKKIQEVSNDTSANQLLVLIDDLERAGYLHYEVSNFSKPGYISRHNSSYWQAENYLGIGPSAHSYNGISRQFNINSNYLYLNALQAGKIPATIEFLTRENKINDCLLTTLRTSWGTNLEALRKDHQYDLLEVHCGYIQKLIENKYATLTKDTLILTRSGRLLADKIASDLFALA